LEKLCQTYWPAVYAFLRLNSRQKPEDAKDLTQGFFAHLIHNDRWQRYAPEKGRFRNWLLKCLKYYLLNEIDRARVRVKLPEAISFTTEEGEKLIESLLASGVTPDEAFDLQWARTLLRTILDSLKKEYEEVGKVERFEVLQPYIADEAERGDYKKAATKLGITEGAARRAAFDLRERFEVVRNKEIRRFASAGEVNAEIRELAGIVSRPRRSARAGR